jgi:hypothetical protein
LIHRIDIFGRGTFGGGGFEASKAMKVVKEEGASVALFAAGWTFEKREGGRSTFTMREDHFWRGIAHTPLLKNSSGDEAFTGWSLQNGGDGWK